MKNSAKSIAISKLNANLFSAGLNNVLTSSVYQHMEDYAIQW